ncbi:MAG: LytTR family DNA-binding domain-containing protein [Phenylobacterium sp.]|uniref:LytTR family DNA-binding domain-containing protein n=1 Tax=Phenylobacterium sp. TaxID=1871053 RepID=UPI00271DF1F4|nr:LytTR family DNA-binding domain-containing protein [Phenylobacterium sp.]MDO9433017.1 LytTR family DNA-binding domain-containing protein [Phenylobacterium sp.]
MSRGSPTAPPAPRIWLMTLAGAAAIGLFLGLIGPFGSYLTGPSWQRVAYWVATLSLGAVAFALPARVILHRGMGRLRTWIWLAALILTASLPFAALIAVIASAVWPHLASRGLLEWYGQVLAISTPLVVGQALLSTRNRAQQAPIDTPAPSATPTNLLGTPPSEVLCLRMEDHYVRVYTRSGSRLVLATMGQAIAAVAPREGLRVHRSWWVARDGVDQVMVEGRNLRLRLTNGVEAQVARSAIAPLRAAGWLDA